MTLDDDLFRRLVLEVVATPFQPNSDERMALSSEYKQAANRRSDADDLSQDIMCCIRKALSAAEGWSFDALESLRRHIVLSHVLFGHPVREAILFIDLIAEAFRFQDPPVQLHAVRLLPLEESASWRGALTHAYRHSTLFPRFLGTEQQELTHLRRLHWRDFKIAEQAAVLRQYGFSVKPTEPTIIDEAESLRVVAELKSVIEELGPLQTSNALFNSLRYDRAQDRYHFPRPVTTGAWLSEPILPVSYLINLCMQLLDSHPARSLDLNQSQGLLKKLRELSTALFAVCYDAQSYVVFEDLFHGPQSITRFLQHRAVYDSAVGFSQLRSRDLIAVLRGLFDWVDEDRARAQLGWYVSDAIEVVQALVSMTDGSRGSVLITKDRLRAKYNLLEPEQFNSILQVLTQTGPLNPGFNLPSDITLVNSWRRPLIPWNLDTFLLTDIRWCGPAFFEAIVDQLRQIWNHADEEVGYAAERFVRKTLREHGLQCLHGEYSVNGVEGECDAVVETPSQIYFLELKKKSFTRLSRSGSDVQLLLDLGASLVDAYVQTAQHEVVLLRSKALDLLDESGQPIALRLDGRTIDKIAVTLLDFGSIQDRLLIDMVLKSLLQAKFGARDASLKGKFDRFETSRAALTQQCVALIELVPTYARDPFFNAWFLSIPQILILLDDVDGAEQFERAMRRTKFVATGSGDFCYDLSEAKRRETVAG